MNMDKCKHEGYWFSIKHFGIFERRYLWCETCLKPIAKEEVYNNADILHMAGNKFFSYYPNN